MTDYNEDSIQIIQPESKFLYLKADDLCKQFPHVAKPFIDRLIEASIHANEPLDNVVRRYLAKDKSAQVGPEFVEAFTMLADQRGRHRP